MIGKPRVLTLSGASVLAIAAASALPPSPAFACQAVPNIRNGVQVVDIICQPGDSEVAPFATSYTGSSNDSTGDGNDTFTMNGGVIVDGAEGGPPFVSGEDTFLDASAGVIQMLGGDDRFIMTGGRIGELGAPITVDLGDGDNFFDMSGGEIWGAVTAGTGNDTFTISGGTILGTIDPGGGTNQIRVRGGTIVGDILGGSGESVITVSGGTVDGSILGWPADTTVIMHDGLVTGFVDADEVRLSGGTIGGDISADTITVTGGRLQGSISGGFGDVVFSGGVIEGNVWAPSVAIYGGTFLGDFFTDIGSETLIIDDGQSSVPIDLVDGVTFSGFDGVGFITNTDLAKFDGSDFRSQNFDGFSEVTLFNSTLGFSGPQQIDQLTLNDGSTLHVGGNVTLLDQFSSGFGDLTLNSSTLSLINGSVGDTFEVGDLTFNNGTLGIDVNQSNAQADQVIVGGVLMVNGTNIVDVNLLDTPSLNSTAEIPIILTGGPIVGDGVFVAQGVPASLAQLFNYQIVPGSDGNLILLASPGDVSPALLPKQMIDTQPVITALDALGGVVNDAIDHGLGLSSEEVGQASPTLGIFASGQWARVRHDGFTVTGNGANGPGPSFTAEDFSLIGSLDWNAAKHFGFEDRYGLNLGLFGGYTSTEVELDSFLGFPTIGHGKNRSGMFGGYGLFRKQFDYVLVAATGFIGETDVVNEVLDTTGSYDTAGYAVTATAGRIIPLSDTVRFDLRGGILGVTFSGDGFTDSGGNNFGKTRVSFGAVKFEPGIFAVHAMENGMVFSPYARGELQQRFGYRNRGSVEGIQYDFKDSDFSASLSAGFNLKMTESTTLSGEVRGKASTDSRTLAAKIGLKASF